MHMISIKTMDANLFQIVYHIVFDQ